MSTSVFSNFFAAAEPYISVKITHGTPWHEMIRESNGVGKVEFSGCLGNDVPSGVERQKNLNVGVWGKTLKC